MNVSARIKPVFLLFISVIIISCGGGKKKDANAKVEKETVNGQETFFRMKLKGKDYSATEFSAFNKDKTETLKMSAVFTNNYNLELRIENYSGSGLYSPSDDNYNEGENTPDMSISLSITDPKYKDLTPSASSVDMNDFSEFIDLKEANGVVTGTFEATVFPLFNESIEAFGFEETKISGEFAIPLNKSMSNHRLEKK